tara:strand:- start:50 stop:571 length:522 start_codon:yes stop_codon:yes gene_type:complete
MEDATQIILANCHPHGFAFAMNMQTKEQVYVPAHVTEGHSLKPGDKVMATLVPNYADKSRDGVAWQCVKIHENGHAVPQPTTDAIILPEDRDEPPASIKELDKAVLCFIGETKYCTTSEIASHFDIDSRSAGNSAQRNFNAGRIARAAVHGRVGLTRPNFILWAINANDFLED